MARNVRCGLIQVHCEWSPEKTSLADIKEKMIAKHERLIARSRQENSANPWAGRIVLWALFLRRTANALVRAD